MRRNVEYLKPPRFRNYFTLQELCDFVGKQPKWIRTLEKEGRIPQAMRVRRGKVDVRLWSPSQADEIAVILSKMRPGRPPSND